MIEKDVVHHEDCFQSYTRLFTDLIRMRKNVQSLLNDQDIEGLADLNYVAKVCEKMMDDLRKAYKNVRGATEKTICLMWVQGGSDEPIRTDYCTVSPDVKIIPKVPSATKEPAEYVEFLGQLGVPRDVAEFGALKIDWPKTVEYCTWLASQGKELPKGAEGKTHNVFVTRVRQKKPISDMTATLPIYDDGDCGVVRVADQNPGATDEHGTGQLY